MPLVADAHVFLSRLFGGKRVHKAVTAAVKFLSRLFGGKPVNRHPLCSGGFLSRLFGGKLRKKPKPPLN